MSMSARHNSGFSLIEIIVVLALTSVAVGCSLFFSMDSYRSQSFYTDRDTLISLLQHARAESLANACAGSSCTAGVPHGVYIENTDYILFQGASFATRDEAQDGVVEASPLVVHASMSEVVFEAQSGDVLHPGVIHLSDTSGHDSILTIGSEGQISWTQ